MVLFCTCKHKLCLKSYHKIIPRPFCHSTMNFLYQNGLAFNASTQRNISECKCWLLCKQTPWITVYDIIYKRSLQPPSRRWLNRSFRTTSSARSGNCRTWIRTGCWMPTNSPLPCTLWTSSSTATICPPNCRRISFRRRREDSKTWVEYGRFPGLRQLNVEIWGK